MRRIGLRVAGLFLAVSAIAGMPLVPVILSFPELKTLEAKVAPAEATAYSRKALAQTHAGTILGPAGIAL